MTFFGVGVGLYLLVVGIIEYDTRHNYSAPWYIAPIVCSLFGAGVACLIIGIATTT